MAHGELLPGLREHAAAHPDWTEEEGSEDGWPQSVNWWSVTTPDGLVLIDPLIEDWAASDDAVHGAGGCAAIVRTVHWHERSVAEAATRYGAPVWAKPPPDADPRWRSHDRALTDGTVVAGAIEARELPRADEVVLWLPGQRALVVADVLLGGPSGTLRVCPDSWLDPGADPVVRARLRELSDVLPIEHVLVAHGPSRLHGGAAEIRAACDR